MQSHKELIVWQKAMDMAVEIQTLTGLYPRDEIYGMVSQMRRSATSIPMNIAEGYSRGTDKELLRFLYIASGSASELDTQIELSKRFGYINAEATETLLQHLTVIRKMLNALITHLSDESRSIVRSRGKQMNFPTHDGAFSECGTIVCADTAKG